MADVEGADFVPFEIGTLVLVRTKVGGDVVGFLCAPYSPGDDLKLQVAPASAGRAAGRRSFAPSDILSVHPDRNQETCPDPATLS
jgi:hypothetical protein